MRKEMKIVLGIFIVSFMLILAACDQEVPPDAPYISGSYNATTSTLTWNAVPGAKEYIVYYGPYPGSSDPNTFSRLASTTDTRYVDYTTYARYYAVKASNSAGTSGFSNVKYAN